jgi:hypothetical protein
MLDGLFGTELPFAVKFILAFVIVLGLILLALWAVRRFGSGGLDGVRGRQHRLSVLEWARVDNRRSLCLIRRDNVEHLLIVGGPTDVVIEANIVRAAAAPREVGMARPGPLDPLPRAVPLPDNGNGAWPLQPEPVTPPPAAARSAPKVEAKFEPKIEPVGDEPAWPPLQPQSETPPTAPPPARPQRDTLAALADELSARPTPPPPPPPRSRPLGAPRILEPRADRAQPRSEPRAPAPPVAAQTPAAADSAADTDAATAAAADQSLAEMAHRLEAALRKPGAPAADARPPAPPRPAPAPAAEQQAVAGEPASPAPPPLPPRSARPQSEPKQPPRNSNAPAKPPQSPTLYDNLEQEMASLLGRPTNKN